MKEYEKTINKNNVTQNSLALVMLLEYGKKNILNEKQFEEISKEFVKSSNVLMSEEYQKEVLGITKELAKMKNKDLYNFIHDKVKEERKIERGRWN